MIGDVAHHPHGFLDEFAHCVGLALRVRIARQFHLQQ